MKKILMAEYLEYNSDFKVGNHHYAKMFAENGYEVLWLSPVYNLMTRLINKKNYYQRKQLNKAEFVKLDNNIYGYSPFSLTLYGKLPLLDTKLACKMSINLTVPNINLRLKNNDFDNVDILWLTNVKYYYLAKKLGFKKLIYRCADDISQFKESCKSMAYFEEKIIKQADQVFVASHNLLEKKKQLREDLIYLPNGMEQNNFIRDEYIIPEEYAHDGRKKCIYVGAVDNWFDLDLVLYCADRLREISFYIIGPSRIDTGKLNELKNIHLLGRKDYKDIPDYLQSSDAAIIPFKVNSLTDSIAPIKLYEYMSAGLNVVSTNFMEMNYIKSPVFLSGNYEKFCSNIEEAIENKYTNREKNIQFASENTWERRFREIEKHI